MEIAFHLAIFMTGILVEKLEHTILIWADTQCLKGIEGVKKWNQPRTCDSKIGKLPILWV